MPTTYIDLASLGPDDDIAEQRAQLLELSGTLVPRDVRDGLLGIVDGTVICGPQALDYFRILPPEVALISIEDTSAHDPLPLRFDSLREWALVCHGIPRSEARALVKTPPKTPKHKHWVVYNSLAWISWDRPTTSLPDNLPTIYSESQPTIEVPYTVTWVNDNETLARATLALQIAGGCASTAEGQHQETQQDTQCQPIIIGIDCESDQVGSTPSEMCDILVGIGIAVANQCYYGTPNNEQWLELLKYRLPHLQWCGHNAKWDGVLLRRNGITIGPLVGDSMLAALLLGEPNARLKDVAQRKLGVRMTTYDEIVGTGNKRIPISSAPPELVASYCCADAYYGVKIEKLLVSELSEKLRNLYHNIDVPLVTILADMQFAGIAIDRPAAATTLVNVLQKQLELEDVINLLVGQAGWTRPDKVTVCSACRNGAKKKLDCGVCQGKGRFEAPQHLNMSSPLQLSEFYYRHLGLPVQRVSKETGKPSVDALALLRMRDKHPTIALVLAWKRLEKYREFLVAWLDASHEDNKIHTTFSNARVRTHRFSSENPNLQQVKVDWREVFIADEDTLLVAGDYDGIEWRLGAYVSRDPGLLKIAQATPGTEEGDLHGQNVKKLFNVAYEEQKLDHNRPLRTRGKNYFFGAMFGSKGDEVHSVIEKQMLEDPNLATLGIPTIKEIRNGINNINDIYGRYFKEWVPFAIYEAIENGCTAYTLYGRPRIIPDLLSRDKQAREAAEREVISLIIQGSAADVMRLSLIDVAKIPGGRPILSVHDEIVCSVDRDGVKEYMTEMDTRMQLGQPFAGVPLVVNMKAGKNWKETHS